MKSLVNLQAIVGESPVWSPHDQCLYWVDIISQKLYVYEPKRGTNQAFSMPDMITTVALRQEGGLLICLRKQIALFDIKTQALTPLFTVEEERADHRFNDGKVDCMGRFWVGTINMHEPTDGSCRLYCLQSQNDLHVAMEDIVFSNGLCWNPDNTLFYHAETFKKTIFVYDFDAKKGQLSHKRPFVTLGEEEGIPDGLSIDAKGGVWCAHFGGSCLVRYDTQGQQTDKVDLPIAHVTNGVFGGPDLDTLFITSGCEQIPPDQRKNYPEAGGLFAVKVPYRGLSSFSLNF